MSASSQPSDHKRALVTGYVYLLIALFCVCFGAIYEHFSHQVYSFHMIYAFLFPLVGGSLVFFGISLWDRPMPVHLACNLYHSGIATLTVGSIFTGVLEIYGTTNRLTIVYWVVGWGFVASALLIACCKKHPASNSAKD